MLLHECAHLLQDRVFKRSFDQHEADAISWLVQRRLGLPVAFSTTEHMRGAFGTTSGDIRAATRNHPPRGEPSSWRRSVTTPRPAIHHGRRRGAPAAAGRSLLTRRPPRLDPCWPAARTKCELLRLAVRQLIVGRPREELAELPDGVLARLLLLPPAPEPPALSRWPSIPCLDQDGVRPNAPEGEKRTSIGARPARRRGPAGSSRASVRRTISTVTTVGRQNAGDDSFRRDGSLGSSRLSASQVPTWRSQPLAPGTAESRAER